MNKSMGKAKNRPQENDDRGIKNEKYRMQSVKQIAVKKWKRQHRRDSMTQGLLREGLLYRLYSYVLKFAHLLAFHLCALVCVCST
jgi:hypothetical protein